VITLAVTFRPTYQGVQGIWMQAFDNAGGGITGMQQKGSWTVTFQPSTVSLSAPSSSTFGQPVALTAMVSPPAATGTVTFYDGATILGDATLSAGTATLGTIALPAGTHSLRAYYSGDGTYDFATSGVVPQTVSTNPGNIFLAASGSPFPAGTAPAYIAMGDFNGDGRPDLAIANSGSNNLSVLLGTGNGGFSAASGSPFSVGYGPMSVGVGDFNRDGLADLAVANETSNGIIVLLGSGSGAFTATPQSPFGTGMRPDAVAIADFNGDGNADLVVANWADNNVSVLLGNGNGGFTVAPGSPYSIGDGPVSLAVGDFNGDGNADLALADATGNTVQILLGNGSGSFKPALIRFTANKPSSVVVGDFNGNGKADVAYTNSGSNNIAVLLGDGTGGFAPAPGSPFAVGAQPSSVAVGDFNADGKPDLAVTNQGESDVTVLLGDGTGRFTPMSGSPFPAGTAPTSVVVGDFNGDGRADLAIASAGSNDVTVLLGLPALPPGTLNGAYPGTTIAPTGGTGPYTWSATGLPPGLSINPSTGAITGTPTSANGSPFLVTITIADSKSVTTILTYGMTISGLCDLNHDGYTNAEDVEIVLGEALGLALAVHDLNHDGAVNVVDVQIVENAALGMGCSAH
jgi:hypothetical protein